MRDDMLDIMLMVVVLGFITATGYTMVKRSESQVIKDAEIVFEDKNTNTKLGDDVREYGEYDGTLSKYDLVLVTQVQDYYMPDPKTFTIDGTRIDIVSTYESELHGYATKAWGIVKDLPEDAKYTIEYSTGTDKADDADDTFVCNQVNK